MLEAVETTARNTENRIRDIRMLMDDWVARVRREKPKVYSRELVELVFRNPYAKIRFVEDARIATTRQTASKYLQALAEIGLLRPVRNGRETYFLNDPLLRLLTG